MPDTPKKFVAGKVLSGRVYPEFFPLGFRDLVLNIGCGSGPQAVVYRGSYSRMVGVDVNADRLRSSLPRLLSDYDVRDYETICANVESIPLPSSSFDAAIAIDIVEHVEHPDLMIREAFRLLKPGGSLLITFPAMHDRYTHAASLVARFFSPKSRVSGEAWNPDAHNQEFPLHEWISLVSRCGFSFVRSRATTMFPPLHLYGIPRFWFSVDCIHTIDRFISSLPVCKNFGQALMCVFRK